MDTVYAQDVMHRYGRNVVFTGLSLSAASGQVVAITGCNGSGKSTLVKILAGLLRPTRGTVRIETGNSQYSHGSNIGLVAPYVNLYEDLTLQENLRFIARLRGFDLKSSYLSEIAAKVGLLSAFEQVLRTYSTGMLQRARFAAALMHGPKVLLLDEPTIGLDRSGRSLCVQVVRDIQATGGTVIIASNSKRDVDLASETVCVEDFAPSNRRAVSDVPR